MDNTLKELLVIIGLFLSFTVVVIYSLFYIQNNYNIVSCGYKIPIQMIVIALVSLSVFVGALVAFIFSINRLKVRTRIKKDLSLTLKFLEPDERKILSELIKNKGTLLQSDIVKNTGFGRVKVTRILKRLEDRGVVVRERFGKKNKIKLVDGLMELFSCKVCK